MRGRVRGRNYANYMDLTLFTSRSARFFLTKIMWGLRERIMEIK